MTSPNTRHQHMLRYSPKPVEGYTKVLGGKSYGPADSALLNTPAAWNLAYLSHDWQAQFQHPDPMFSTHVRRSIQTRMDGTGLGLLEDESSLVGSMMAMTAPRFVYLIRRSQALTSLPLYLAYGKSWLDTVDSRARHCEWGAPDEPNIAALSLDAARSIIAKVQSL